jgi:hypothetical protein
MRIKVGGLAAILGAAALCFSASAFGQLTNGGTVTVTFTNAPDGIYDPYQGTVTNGGGPLNVGGLISCDDDTHEISAPETWTATSFQMSQLNSGNVAADTVFGSHIGIQGYAELAPLLGALYSGQTSLTIGATTVTGLTNVDLSQAIWIITSSSLGDPSTPPGNIGGITSNASTLVAALALQYGWNPTTNTLTVADASTAQTSLGAYSNLWILNPNANGNSLGLPQEMGINAPEGGAAFLYLLLAGAACFGAMRFKSRHQLAA